MSESGLETVVPSSGWRYIRERPSTAALEDTDSRDHSVTDSVKIHPSLNLTVQLFELYYLLRGEA